MFELVGLLIPIGIIYLIVKYDKKGYVKSFLITCFSRYFLELEILFFNGTCLK